MTIFLTNPEEGRDALQSLFDEAGRCIGFCGAGLSTESGIPDFRSPGSPWLSHAPINFADFMRSPTLRAEAWRRKFAIDDAAGSVMPNRGHLALAHLVESGRMDQIITQNIDGLQQKAGTHASKIIELHGNGTYATCLSCGLRHELADIRPKLEETGHAPVCDACGGPVKSATIAFGQSLPDAVLREAVVASRSCDLFFVIGSSLKVRPASSLPLIAKEHGARLVILNREETALDAQADLVIRSQIGPVMDVFRNDDVESFLEQKKIIPISAP